MKENKLKVLFDSNVLIDIFTKRENSNDSINCFLLMSKGVFSGYIVTKQVTDIYYSLRRYINNDETRKDIIFKLISLFTIIDLRRKDLTNALNLRGNDYEDNVLIVCAKANKLNYILTNDKNGFKNSYIESISANKFLSILRNHK